MNPYVLMLLQRIGASPGGQKAVDLLDRMKNFEGSRIPLIRGAGGRYLPATAAQKVPLAPIGRGIAGAGAAGSVALDPDVSRLLFSQLEERGAAASSPPATGSPFSELNERGAAGRDLMPTRAAPVMSAPMSAADLEGPSTYVRQAPIMSSAMRAADLDGPSTYRRAPRLEDAPPPQRRPAEADVPMPPRRPDTGAAESVLSRIFSGKDYQSNSRPVVEDRRVNWGDPESAADFFRADRAARELGLLPPMERASGGQVGEQAHGKPPKDAALVKALEIIERLMTDRR